MVRNVTAQHFTLEEARIVQEYLKKEGIEFEIKILSNPTKIKKPISIRCNWKDWDEYRNKINKLLHFNR